MCIKSTQWNHWLWKHALIRPKKICVFTIAWSSKLGSIGVCFTYKYVPSSKITQTCSFLSYYSLLIIWHAVQVFGSKHRSNVQGNEENSNRKPVFNKSISINRLSESVNIATVKCLLLKSETEMNFWILPIYYFFGIQYVRVGLVDRKHTYFFGP